MSRNLVRAVAALGVLAFLAGVVVTGWGAWQVRDAGSMRNWPEVEGKVARVIGKDRDPDYVEQKVAVRYTVDGTTRTVTGSWTGDDRETEDVRYRPDDPADAYTKPDAEYLEVRRMGNAMMTTAGGVVMVALGIGALVLARVLPRTRSWLRRNGRPVDATVTRLELAGQSNGQPAPPWIIQAVWEDSDQPGRTHPVRSKPLWFDVRSLLRPGDRLDVRVHPRHPDRYLIRLPNGHET